MAGATDFQISFHDDMPEADRRDAERSVASLVEHSLARTARERAAEAELAELTDAMEAPLTRLVQQDAAAARAAEALAATEVLHLRESDALREDGASYFPPHIRTDVRSVGFVPPYDFSWAWHDGAGFPPHNRILNRSTGEVGLDARSGSLPDGVSGLVAAHAGFGVVLPTTNPGQKFPHAVLNPGRYAFALKTVGVGSNATSEGGFELTVFEDGRFLVGAGTQLWRSRISAGEESRGGDGPRPMTGPELQFTMVPGRSYVFNAGIWVVTDRSTGIGAAAAQSLLQGTITRMWMFG
ncbi:MULTISPECIES: hypothetical protein [unclassified Streptomyces]|uniref:hypothetical protein n=1 Tax=unclassified Streptomyces TaxID=2593676 RepID=UPI002E369005|nr:hypothetical protein [Streptomyces sp. NBC_01268]